MSRIAAVPLLIWALSPVFPWQHVPGAQEIVASVIFVMASITDGLDGYLARRRGQITTLGMLLDPLADKLLVTAGYICLVSFTPTVVKAWIAVLVIGREFLVNGLRSIAASEGFTIQASEIGKLKTVIQIVSVTTAIMSHGWQRWDIYGFIFDWHLVAVTAIYWMTIVSIISAVDYFVGFWKKIDNKSESRRKRRSFVLNRKKKVQVPNASGTQHIS